ncbi:hypothetical protein PybrP1_007147 [[Pythium] brassicae (nom. inval.)]|nr:hypothetical protein PybrP1_007147 [[Pythium] brassicae (nom. inval.)]
MSLFPKISLKYFPTAARAEAARLALHIGGIPFIDERIPFSKFATEKDKYPFDQLLVLEIDGRVFAQSQAALRYAGRLSGLYPTSDAAAALRVDEIINVLEDTEQKMEPSLRENDPKKKKAMRLELAEITIPRYLSQLEARLATLVKYATLETKDVLLHDLAIYAYIKHLRAGSIDHIPATIADGYTLLNASFEKVSRHPKVVEWNDIQHSVPRLKLAYFAFGGRAEAIRLALAIGGIPFEDERLSMNEFASRKASLPFNQLPVLEVDGDVIAQSLAILRYIGIWAGLYPTSDLVAAFRIDEIFGIVDEFSAKYGPARNEQDPVKREIMLKEAAEVSIPELLGFLEMRAAQNMDGPYVVGSNLTVADLVISGLVGGLMSGHMPGLPATLADPFGRLNDIHKLVRSHPKVIKWFKGPAENS